MTERKAKLATVPMYVICSECWSAAVRRFVEGTQAQVQNLRCASDACARSRKWVTERVWGYLNCQGHCACLEVAGCIRELEGNHEDNA